MILVPLNHPSQRRLTEFATGGLTRGARARAARHLLRCAPCRDAVCAIEALCVRAADLDAITPRNVAAAAVLARRGAGERMILPVAPPAGRTQGWARTRLAAASLAAAVILALVMTWPPPAGAGALSGELRFIPATTSPGSVVRVEYTAPGILAGEPVLHLRGRWRDGDGSTGTAAPTALLVTRLHLRADDVFTGEFRIPGDAVYGIFTVEDPAGERLDTNLGRHWELLTGDGSDAVSFDALRAQWTELLRNSFGRAWQVVRGATERFPQHAEAWGMLAHLEKSLLEGAAADSSLALHTGRLAAFHQAATSLRDLTPAEMAALYSYAGALGDTARRAVWRDRLLAEAPDSRIAVQERMIATFQAHWQTEPAAALDSLEALWTGTLTQRPLLAQQGLILARRVGEPVLIRRWADRSAGAAPAGAVSVALALAEVPALRAEALDRLRSLVAAPDPTPRPLASPVAEHAAAQRGLRAARLAALGRALLIAADTLAAADTLGRAAELAWSLPVFEAALRPLLVAGDTAGSQRNAARIVVDPTTPPGRRSDLDAATRAAAGEAAWDSLLAHARTEMHERTLARATTRSLPERSRLWTPSGQETRLGDVLAGEPVIVTVISRYCGYSLEELPALAAFSREMQARGVSVIAITSDPPSAGLATLLAQKNVDVPLYHDLRGEVNDALQAWETPTYYVIDWAGRLRFAKSLRLDIPRQIASLRAQQPPVDR